MFSLRRPDPGAIRRVLQAPGELTYRGGGDQPGFNVDHNRAMLGIDCFDLAREAVRNWKMFDLGWVELCYPANASIAEGTVVAPMIRHLGFWSVNPARIVRVIDEPRRFGFTYATLQKHAECGEEQFLVEWLPNGEVWYDLRAISRPQHWLAWLGYPVTRALQKRFAQHSMRAMQRAVRGKNQPAHGES